MTSSQLQHEANKISARNADTNSENAKSNRISAEASAAQADVAKSRESRQKITDWLGIFV